MMLRKSVEAEKRRFESLVESASSIIVGLDLQGRITLLNHGVEATLGYRKSEAIGKSVFDLFVPDEARQAFIKRATKAARKEIFGKIPHGITPVRTKDGSQIQVTWTVNLLTDEKDDAAGFIGIGQDITEMINLEEELKDRNRILEVLNQLGLTTSISFDTKEIVSAALEMTLRFFGFKKGVAFIVNSINADILPRMNSWGSTFSLFPSSPVAIGAGFAEPFCQVSMSQSIHCVAFLGVSVLPLHTSLSACNRDISLSMPDWMRYGDIPNFLAEGFVMIVSCVHPIKDDLSAGLFTNTYLPLKRIDLCIHPTIQIVGFLLRYPVMSRGSRQSTLRTRASMRKGSLTSPRGSEIRSFRRGRLSSSKTGRRTRVSRRRCRT